MFPPCSQLHGGRKDGVSGLLDRLPRLFRVIGLNPDDQDLAFLSPVGCPSSHNACNVTRPLPHDIAYGVQGGWGILHHNLHPRAGAPDPMSSTNASRTSVSVMIPTSTSPSTTGRLPILWVSNNLAASSIVVLGVTVTTCLIITSFASSLSSR